MPSNKTHAEKCDGQATNIRGDKMINPRETVMAMRPALEDRTSHPTNSMVHCSTLEKLDK